jgi:hypothetical protein
MLRIRSRLSPDERTGGAFDRFPVSVHRLPVTLHPELLQIGRKTRRMIVVRQYRVRRNAEEIAVPDADQRQQHRQVLIV